MFSLMDSSVPSFKKKIKRPKVSFGIERTGIEDLIGSIEKSESSSFEKHKKANIGLCRARKEQLLGIILDFDMKEKGEWEKYGRQ